jgi:hypothetical protein
MSQIERLAERTQQEQVFRELASVHMQASSGQPAEAHAAPAVSQHPAWSFTSMT